MGPLLTVKWGQEPSTEPTLGTELARLDHTNAVEAVAFSPDSAQIATVSEGSAWVHALAADLVVEQALARMTRNLTPEEWQRYFPEEPRRRTHPGLP